MHILTDGLALILVVLQIIEEAMRFKTNR